MTTLQEIKSRISAVGKIQKITKAMQLVATAKLIKSKKSLKDIQKYYCEVYDVFKEIIGLVKDVSKIFKQSPDSKDLYILITSDLGLCGAYNSKIIKLAKANLKSGDKIVVVGSKGISAFKKVSNKIADFKNIGELPNYLIASEIAKIVISKFLAGEIKSVKIIHTEYINPILYESKITTILPVEVDMDKKKMDSKIEFEPNPETIIINSLPLYISAILYGVITKSKVAEMSSRRMAMENASDNANELIEKLNLKYNRARQSKITQEISEIIVGSEI